MFCLLLGTEAQGDPAEGEAVFGAEARFVLRHRPAETAEGLKEKWLERFRDAMAPDGQNLLAIDACPSGSTNEPAIVYLDLRNAAADRSHLFLHPQPAK